MKARTVPWPFRGWLIFSLCGTLTATLLYFFVFNDLRRHPASLPPLSVGWWLWHAWDDGFSCWNFWWLTLLAVGVAIISGVRRAKSEPVTPNRWGLFWLMAGLLFWFWGDRTRQICFSCLSLPLLLFGGFHFVQGPKKARHFRFALLLFVLLVPLPVDEWIHPLWGPADRLTEVFYHWMGGVDYRSSRGMFGSAWVNFHYLIPVSLTCFFMARFLLRSVRLRFLLLLLLPPVLVLTEAQRAAAHARLYETGIDLKWVPWKVFEVFEMLAMMALAAGCFSLSLLFRRRPARVSSEIATAA